MSGPSPGRRLPTDSNCSRAPRTPRADGGDVTEHECTARIALRFAHSCVVPGMHDLDQRSLLPMKPTENTLVLGSAGFIGSAITRHLCRNGATIFALGRSENESRENGVVRIRGSIEDSGLLREVLRECRHIVYSASITTPGTSANEPSLEILGNLLPLSRLLECATEFPARHLVYLSSGGTVYGDGARGANESTPLRPRSYYGAGKVAAEALLHACSRTTSWTTTILRPTNPYGPGQNKTKGFAIVPTLFQRALDASTFQIWGDGSSVRDFLYIDDLASAVFAAPRRGVHDVFNVSSGEVLSINELVEMCKLVSRRGIQTEYLPPRGIDVPHVSPTHAALTSATGWTPRISLRDGLTQTWDWILRNAGEQRL